MDMPYSVRVRFKRAQKKRSLTHFIDLETKADIFTRKPCLIS